KRGKGMKIMAIVDRHGLPLSVSTHAANHHEVRLVQLCFDFYMIEAKPENLIGDEAFVGPACEQLSVRVRRSFPHYRDWHGAAHLKGASNEPARGRSNDEWVPSSPTVCYGALDSPVGGLSILRM